jgi:hypothetical protein
MTVLANVNVTRPNVSGILLANQPVQIDEASEMMGAYYNSAHPYDVLEIFVDGTTFVFQRGDLLTDTVNIDPLTSTYTAYRVVGNPAPFPDMHVELKANRFVGKQS